MVYISIIENAYVDGQRASVLVASAKPKFDIPKEELDVVVTFGDRGLTIRLRNCSYELFANEIVELSCTLGRPGSFEESLEAITGVRAQTPKGSMRCVWHQNSTMEELVYACEFQS